MKSLLYFLGPRWITFFVERKTASGMGSIIHIFTVLEAILELRRYRSCRLWPRRM